MMLGAACLEHCKILLLEALLALAIAGIKRVHQAVAEGIGIDVERRVDEMRDIAPEGLIARTEVDCRSEAFGLHLEPDLAEPIGCKLAVLARRVDFALE